MFLKYRSQCALKPFKFLPIQMLILKYSPFLQEKQIIPTAWSTQERLEESAVGQNINGWSKSHQCHYGEDAQTAANGHCTVPKFTHRPDGYSKSGMNIYRQSMIQLNSY